MQAGGDPCSPAQEKVAEGEKNGGIDGEEEQALLFLDSLDGYLTLLDSLSFALRQGWLEVASARQSMGSSRVSSTLLDLKAQSAATTVLLDNLGEGPLSVPQPRFTLSKWACLEEKESSAKEVIDEKFLEYRNGLQLRHRGSKLAPGTTFFSESAAVDANLRALSLLEDPPATSKSATVDENKQRYRKLSVFGAFVSPKLRAAQFSFETALETIVELANVRSSMLSSFSQLQKASKSSD